MTATDIKVIKRDGRTEDFDIEKIHKVTAWAVEDLTGVSQSDLEMHASLQLHNNITTKEIHEVLINAANSLITEKTPNYQYVAARLLLFSLRKEVYGQFTPVDLKTHIENCVRQGVYDPIILKYYTDEELQRLDSIIQHQRDFNFTYAGLQQMVDKYLVKDRKTGKIYETPQMAYMLIAMTIFKEYDDKINWVKRYYNAISKFKINLPTPMVAGVRTPIRQYSSCTLIDVDDNLDSILSSNSAIGYYTARRAGIGLNISRIRPAGSKIRGGEVISTGIIPFLKMFAATTKSMTQNGVRGGGATVHLQWWHLEIEDFIVLKNNRGSEDNRIRTMDYSIVLDRLFYERVKNDEEITLFDPHEVPELYETFGTDRFKEAYERSERRWSLTTKKIRARELFRLLCQERIETSRIYVMNIDHANEHGPFDEEHRPVMSNLCQEILLPTKPIQHIDDEDGEIALCILSAVNLGAIGSDLSEMEEVCELIVRSLDFVIDHQDYPVKAAKTFTMNWRALGVGITNLAYYFAKKGVKYTDPEAAEIANLIGEHLQYYLLKASNKLAQEKGACPNFKHTKYAKGILPIDRYCKAVDDIVSQEPTLDWETLRQDIMKYGLRHATLSAIAPTESSAVVSNATNGIEPVRSLLTVKQSKCGPLRMIVPEYHRLKNRYQLAFDMDDNRGYLNVVAALQKWVDQSISANTYYDFTKYPDGVIPLSEIGKTIFYAYKMGVKTLYYLNTHDGNEQMGFQESDEEQGCAGGACSI